MLSMFRRKPKTVATILRPLTKIQTELQKSADGHFALAEKHQDKAVAHNDAAQAAKYEANSAIEHAVNFSKVFPIG